MSTGKAKHLRVTGCLVVAAAFISGLVFWLQAGAAEAQKMLFFRIASGAAGGTYFPMAGLLAQVISNPPGARSCTKGGNCGMEGLVAFAQSAHGSVANVSALDADQVESAFVQSDVTFWAYTGTGPLPAKRRSKSSACCPVSIPNMPMWSRAGTGRSRRSMT